MNDNFVAYNSVGTRCKSHEICLIGICDGWALSCGKGFTRKPKINLQVLDL